MNKAENNPFFSIVIVNFNYGRFLEEAILSVLGQSCQDFELIIIDGGSSDNSVEIIKKYQDRLAWWCSEKDHGQSHAFNKGFTRAKGTFLTWLNADDLLMPETFACAKKKLLKHPDAAWMTGNVFRFAPDGKVIECRWGPWGMPRFLQGSGSPVAVFGPTSFFSRDLFWRVGGMDESLHYVMDTDLWMRFIVAHEPCLRLNRYCWAFRMHEMSKTAEYDGHRLGQNSRDQLNNEIKKSCLKNNYRCSKLNHFAQLIWRMMTFSEVKSTYMAVRWKGLSMGNFIATNCSGKGSVPSVRKCQR